MEEQAPSRLQVEICSPEREPIHFEVDELVLPGELGVFTVLSGHTPMLTTLTQGVMIAYAEGKNDRHYAINGGFAEVLNDRILILARTVESREEVDIERAREAHERAEAQLKKSHEDLDLVQAEAALARALARIEAHAGEDFS
jgi:F-type H+-transporting ATPase subunit epsilon